MSGKLEVYFVFIINLLATCSLVLTAPSCPEDEIKSNSLTLTFPTTQIGFSAIPEKFCVDSKYRPILRRCLKNGTWSTVHNDCEDERPSKITEDLFTLEEFMKAKELHYVLVSIKEVTSVATLEKLGPFDFYLISRILFDSLNVDHQEIFLFFEVINNLMNFDEDKIIVDASETILDVIRKNLLRTKHSSINCPFSLIHINTYICTDSVGDRNFRFFADRSLTNIEVVVNFKESCGKTYHLVLFRNSLFCPIEGQRQINSRIVQILPTHAAGKTFSVEITFKILNYNSNGQKQFCCSWESCSWVCYSDAELSDGLYKCRVNKGGIFAIISDPAVNHTTDSDGADEMVDLVEFEKSSTDSAVFVVDHVAVTEKNSSKDDWSITTSFGILPLLLFVASAVIVCSALLVKKKIEKGPKNGVEPLIKL